MKVSLSLFFLFLTISTYGQRPHYRGQPLDTLIITSDAGVCLLDKKGTCIGQKDSFIIFFDKNALLYKARYKREFAKRMYKIESEKIRAKQFKNRKVEPDVLDSLFTSLLVKYKKPTAENLGFNKNVFSKFVTNKKILQIAKRHKEDWQFKRKYSTKTKNNVVFNDCKNIDTFNLFLDEYKIDTAVGMVITCDIWDDIDLYIKAGNIKDDYKGVYGNTCKQPWYNQSDTTVMIWPVSIFNFDINKWLFKILPDNFYRKHTIGNDCIAYIYIEWFLRRREIIYD